MTLRTRRDLFADVGRGMFVAALGPALAADLGFALAPDRADSDRLTFGDLEPLVAFLQETPPDKLLPKVVEKLKAGTDLKQFVAAAALCNARAFGGEDYVGFHTLMALAPAYKMATEEAGDRRALPVMKVMHRNSTRLKEVGHTRPDVLKPVEPGRLASDRRPGEQLRDAARKADLAAAEAAFAAASQGKPQNALDAMMEMVDDATEVHRVVLVSRAWDLINFVGVERAHTMLRQSVHYCVKAEAPNQAKYNQPVRDILPRLLDEHKLLGSKPGTKSADDAWVATFAETVFGASPADGAGAVAAAIAEGFKAEDIGEALSLAANQLLLRDWGRPKEWAQANKPVGSVHGDSIGVHSCDTIHAWRNLVRSGDRRTQVTSLVLAGFQVARDRNQRAAEFLKWEPYPRGEHAEKVKGVPADGLMKALDAAIREKDQGRAAGLAARIGGANPDAAKEVFALLRGYGISEDGALHAEKYYGTASDEFAAGRPAFRWRQVVALARVTASAYGYPAPGHKEACELLKG